MFQCFNVASIGLATSFRNFDVSCISMSVTLCHTHPSMTHVHCGNVTFPQWTCVINHWLIFGSSSLHPSPPSQPRCPSSLPNTELQPTRCPSPLPRDVGPPPALFMEENTKGNEELRGDPGNGRPRWCVTKTSHDFCRGSFSPFSLSSPSLNPSPQQPEQPGGGQR